MFIPVIPNLFVWHVAKNQSAVREAVVGERVYPPPAGPEWGKAKRSGEAKISDEIMKGWWEGYKPPPLPEA